MINVKSTTINQNPTSDHEVANKKYVDNTIGENNILRFKETLQYFLQVTVGNTTYNLTKYKKQITDTTENKSPNTGTEALQKWNIYCNIKLTQSRITDFIRQTKTNSPTGHSGATKLPPIGNSFMFIETSSNNHCYERVFVIWERTDIIQISNITFYYNR